MEREQNTGTHVDEIIPSHYLLERLYHKDFQKKTFIAPNIQYGD